MTDLHAYLDFARKHPDRFANPAGAVFRILLDDGEIRQVEAEMERKLRGWGATAEQAVEWSRVGIAYQDQYLFILRDAVRFPDGSPGTYIRLIDPAESAPGVIVLPIHQGRVLLIRHFRHATRERHLEIPRGFGEDGQSSEENARRELAEEIGAAASRLVSLGRVHPDTGLTDSVCEMFYAEVETYTQPDENEAISDVLAVTTEDFDRLVRDGDITDGYTLAAYARAKARGLL